MKWPNLGRTFQIFWRKNIHQGRNVIKPALLLIFLHLFFLSFLKKPITWYWVTHIHTLRALFHMAASWDTEFIGLCGGGRGGGVASLNVKWLPLPAPPPPEVELLGVFADIVPKLLLRSNCPCWTLAEAEWGGGLGSGLKLGLVPSLPGLKLKGGGGYRWPRSKKEAMWEVAWFLKNFSVTYQNH